jgi:hypothetical protein
MRLVLFDGTLLDAFYIQFAFESRALSFNVASHAYFRMSLEWEIKFDEKTVNNTLAI